MRRRVPRARILELRLIQVQVHELRGARHVHLDLVLHVRVCLVLCQERGAEEAEADVAVLVVHHAGVRIVDVVDIDLVQAWLALVAVLEGLEDDF